LVIGLSGDYVDNVPDLSASQVRIAVEEATDAARNAVDLMLT
jgi:high-affinity K+ transport system ATPase subunit B